MLFCGGMVLFKRVVFPTDRDLGIVFKLRDGNSRAISFDSSGTLLAITDETGGARILRVPGGQEQWRLPPLPEPAVDVLSPEPPYLPERVAFSPDGRYLAQTGKRGFRVWSLAQNMAVALAGAPTTAVGALTFLPDGQLQIRAAAGGISRWRLPSGAMESYPAAPIEQWERWDFGGHGRWALSCRDIPGSGLIRDMEVIVREVGGGATGRVLIREGGACVEMRLSPDEKTLAVKSLGTEYYLLDWRAGLIRQTFDFRNANDGQGIAFSPDGSRVYLGESKIIQVRNVRDGRWSGRVTALPWHDWTPPVRFSNLQVSSDGRLLAARCGDLTIRIWRI